MFSAPASAAFNAGISGGTQPITISILKAKTIVSFNHTDAAAIAATLNGPFKVLPTQTSHGLLCRIVVNSTDNIPDSIDALSKLIEACARWGEDGSQTTVWVDVDPEGPDLLPIVIGAAKRLVGFGVGLFVSCGIKASHEPGELLSEQLRHAVARAQRDGTLWHALAEQEVPTAPASFI